MKKLSFILFLLLPVIVFSQIATLNVLDTWRMYSDKENALYKYYLSQAEKDIAEREMLVAGLTTKSDWVKHQKEIRKILGKVIGTFPEKTPLNAKVVGVSEKEDYRVEKIIYESRPEFYVTAALYIPKNLKGKAPAIIHVIGHMQEAFRKDHYQRSAINFVKKGFIVLTFDPIGQGERVQYYSPELGKSAIGGTVEEHMYMGLQTLLVGKSLANYFVWDGIRAVDYLISRKDVDAVRIGITGLSGGGAQTTFISAVDDRIYASAPSCFVTSMKRLFESAGPQDAEQNLYHALADGIDFADYLEVRIPKPALLVTTSRDFFSVQGAKETEKEVKRVYEIFDAGDNFGRAEADSTHSMPSLNRIARHRFFQKALNLPGDPADVEVKFLDKELQITKSGQVLTSFGGETVFSINKKEAEKLVDKLESSRKNLDKHLKVVKQSAKELSGYIKPDKIEDLVFTGRFQRNGYSIERYFIKSEGEYAIPFLLYLPNTISGASVVYLNKDGKSGKDTVFNDINDEIREDILLFVKQGHPVLAADLLGFGEMQQKLISWPRFGEKYGTIDYNLFFASVQLNRSLVGIQAGDIERLVMFIKQDRRLNANGIYAIASGRLLCASLLHNAAFEGDFSKVALIDPLVSYRSLVMNKYYYSNGLSCIVPGALTAYDIPDLEAAVAPNSLMLVNIRNHTKDIASEKILKKDLKVVKSSFSALTSDKKLQIKKTGEKQNLKNIFESWLNN